MDNAACDAYGALNNIWQHIVSRYVQKPVFASVSYWSTVAVFCLEFVIDGSDHSKHVIAAPLDLLRLFIILIISLNYLQISD